jgi:phosphoglycolate phosphatase
MLPGFAINPDSLAKDWSPPQARPDWQARWLKHEKRAVLFDLDGTLLDTSPDLGGAANAMRLARGLPALSIHELRPYCSHGARGMILKALNVGHEEPGYEELRQEFLRHYESRLCEETQFLPGLDQVVDKIEEAGMVWGVVTNKFARFTEPLLEAMNLRSRMAVCISGDSAAFPKPHPAPLQMATEKLGLPAQAVVYLGDDQRDITSGFHAGCFTMAVAMADFELGTLPESWGADALATNAQEICSLLKLNS